MIDEKELMRRLDEHIAASRGYQSIIGLYEVKRIINEYVEELKRNGEYFEGK